MKTTIIRSSNFDRIIMITTSSSSSKIHEMNELVSRHESCMLAYNEIKVENKSKFAPHRSHQHLKRCRLISSLMLAMLIIILMMMQQFTNAASSGRRQTRSLSSSSHWLNFSPTTTTNNQQQQQHNAKLQHSILGQRFHQIADKRSLSIGKNSSFTGNAIDSRSPEAVASASAAAAAAAAANAPISEQELDDQARAAHWSLPNRPSLFSIIRFPNEECFDSSNQSGTCYTAFECKLLGGQPSSPCAAGFGSCCIVSRSCHVSTREKVVYFKNPSYPSADSEERFCDLTVEVSDPNVCQLRLDFLDFQLDPPTQGACRDDYMEISASGIPPLAIPRLCGLNRNQHLYISVPQDYNQADRSASIVFYTDPVGDHRWQVKITQIDCNLYKPIDWRRGYAKLVSSPIWNAHPNGPGNQKLPLTSLAGTKYSTTFASGFQAMSQTASALAYELLKPQFTPRAPMGCLQYFTSTSGLIESFNFGQYLNNLDYSICIQRQPETCRVFFSSSDYDWSINGVGVSASTSGVGDQDCSRDYLMIPGGSRTGDGLTYDRFCGGRLHYYRGQTLSAPVLIKSSGPIVLRFHSDAHYEGLNNGGFRIQYDQSAQDCIFHTQEEAGSLASQQLVAATLSDSRPFGSGNGMSLVESSPSIHYSSQLSSGQQQLAAVGSSVSTSGARSDRETGPIKRQDLDETNGANENVDNDQHVLPEPPSSMWNLSAEASKWFGSGFGGAAAAARSSGEQVINTNSTLNRRTAALRLVSELGRAFKLALA